MGKNNKQRRAASKRKRRRGAGGGPAGGRGQPPPGRGAGSPRPGPPPSVEDLLLAAVHAPGPGDAVYEALLRTLTQCAGESLRVLDRLLADTMAGLWQAGWTPSDVVGVAGRRLSVAHADLAAALALADGRKRERRREALHPRWQAQLAALAERAGAARLHVPVLLEDGVALLHLLARLPPVPPTVPAPGAPETSPAPAAGLDERVLARVRALLAKAESTEFDEEAEALTAKAQELVARHAIDDALLHSDRDVGQPSVRRIPVEDPYADAKSLLLSAVAGANRCRAVYSPGFGWSTVFGYDGDLDAVELLTTSLLAQATGTMARLGPRRDASGRSRTRSFRRSFLLGFADRVGQRLAEATAAQVSASDTERLLPVLSTREDRLDAAVAGAFPELVHKAGTASHAAGFAAGQAAADLASLDLAAARLGEARAS